MKNWENLPAQYAVWLQKKPSNRDATKRIDWLLSKNKAFKKNAKLQLHLPSSFDFNFKNWKETNTD